MGPMISSAVAGCLFLAVGALALFGFLAVATWSDSRASERIAYYENDMLKKLADSSGEGAKQAFEFLREQKRIEARKRREGLKMGGLVTTAVWRGFAGGSQGQSSQGPCASGRLDSVVHRDRHVGLCLCHGVQRAALRGAIQRGFFFRAALEAGSVQLLRLAQGIVGSLVEGYGR